MCSRGRGGRLVKVALMRGRICPPWLGTVNCFVDPCQFSRCPQIPFCAMFLIYDPVEAYPALYH
ncbi:hypothetical protein KUTeg_014583 [Tegillarca granosa]|uniref:Uncharacterized protein n=1 Tax=Tegillarca granosa TaxID=220873 RepID=A0ABQ9ERS8_TEGGR|nr:hypothetical protein KUTeg_014583 [Tegillarca granosa]